MEGDGGFFNVKSPMGRGSTRQTQTGMQVTRFDRDEYVAEVTGSSTAANFLSTPYPCNPGQALLFPWLSTVIANKFEKYRFRYIEFYIKREVSEFNTGGSQGKVGLSFDTDAADPPPQTKQQAEDTHPQASGMPCENIRLRIPTPILRRFLDGFFIRPGMLPGGTDIKTYDIGNLNVWTQNLGANSATVGELHVRYGVDVFIPVLESSAAAPANNQVAQFSQASVNGGATTVATVVPLATADVNGIAAVNTAGSIVLAPGNYLLDVTDNAVFSQTNQFDTAQLQIKKNGVQLFNQTTIQNWPAVVTEAGEFSQHLSSFYTSNGTDALTIVVTDTYAAGTVAHTTSLRIVVI